MSILTFSVRPWRSALVAQLSSARRPFRERAGVIIQMRDGDGFLGLGEASPLEGFSKESLDDVLASLRGMEAASLELSDPAGSVGRLGLPPSAAHGLEQALWDLRGQREGCPSARLLGGRGECEVAVSRLVRDAAEALNAVEQGIGTLKLKVGVAALSEECSLVHDIREAVGPGVGIRLDANGAWSLPEALVALEQLGVAGLELVEQPLAVDSRIEEWRDLQQVGVPIAADESVRDEPSLQRFLGVVDAVVLKPMFIGSMYRAVSMGRTAIEAGCAVVVTSSLDSGVGRFGALHVAAALAGSALLPCGLDTGRLLENDPCSGPLVLAGSMRVSGAGLGIPGRVF